MANRDRHSKVIDVAYVHHEGETKPHEIILDEVSLRLSNADMNFLATNAPVSNKIKLDWEEKLTLTQQDQLDMLESFHGSMSYTLVLLACANAANDLLKEHYDWEDDKAEHFAKRMIGRGINLFGKYVENPDLLNELMDVKAEVEDE